MYPPTHTTSSLEEHVTIENGYLSKGNFNIDKPKKVSPLTNFILVT